MSVATLDTHEVVKDLLSAGFTDEQAEAVARNLRKAQELDLSALATKVDVEAVRIDIEKARTDVEKVRGELRAEIEKVRGEIKDSRSDIIKWTFGVVGVQTLILLGTVIKLVKP